MSANSLRLGVGAIILLGGIFALLQVTEARSAAERLKLDRKDLQELQHKLAEIRKLSHTPQIAAFEAESADQIPNRIENALEQAGLAKNVLANQSPSEPKRMGQTDFMIRRVEITLNKAPIEQIVSFCNALKDESTGSLVRDLRFV